MKQVERQVTKIVTETAFEATDGTLFTDKEECKKYEESALGVLRTRLSKLFVNEPVDAWALMGGMDEHTIRGVALSKEEDIYVFLQWFYAEHPYCLNDSHKEYREALEKNVRNAYESKDLLLIGQNCEGDYYYISTRNTIINNLNNLDKHNSDKHV